MKVSFFFHAEDAGDAEHFGDEDTSVYVMPAMRGAVLAVHHVDVD
jgi:hypothetical protein